MGLRLWLFLLRGYFRRLEGIQRRLPVGEMAEGFRETIGTERSGFERLERAAVLNRLTAHASLHPFPNPAPSLLPEIGIIE